MAVTYSGLNNQKVNPADPNAKFKRGGPGIVSGDAMPSAMTKVTEGENITQEAVENARATRDDVELTESREEPDEVAAARDIKAGVEPEQAEQAEEDKSEDKGEEAPKKKANKSKD